MKLFAFLLLVLLLAINRSQPMRFTCLLLSLLLSLSVAYAQTSTRSELEKRRASLLSEIEATQQQLESTKKDQKATLSQLNALNAKLNARQKLIDNINSELVNINGNIDHSTSEIHKLNKNLDVLKLRYAQSLRYAYKHKVSQNMLAFLFSSNDFNDMIRRMSYLKRYRDYRKDQANEIRVTQKKLTAQIGVLNSQKSQKGTLLKAEELQKKEIQDERQQTNIVAIELKGREKELIQQIQQNQKTAKKLESSIKAQIQKEIELARKKAEEEARKKAAAEALARKKEAEEEARRKAAAAERERSSDENAFNAGSHTVTLNTGTEPSKNAKGTGTSGSAPTQTTAGSANTPASKPAPTTTVTATEAPRPASTASYKLSLTPEAQALSNSFAANKGRLPWPVEKGYVSDAYGKHPHPLFPKVTIDNNGIDITTSEGAAVRAIYDGVVQTVANIDGVMVMVNHGEYFTVYTKLSGASVKVGDKVTTKQIIGRAGKNDDGENMVNFQVWKVGSNNSLFTVNPTEWIAR